MTHERKTFICYQCKNKYIHRPRRDWIFSADAHRYLLCRPAATMNDLLYWTIGFFHLKPLIFSRKNPIVGSKCSNKTQAFTQKEQRILQSQGKTLHHSLLLGNLLRSRDFLTKITYIFIYIVGTRKDLCVKYTIFHMI